MALLKIFSAGTATQLELGEATVTIGRAAGNTLVLPDLAASSRHAQIVHDENGWRLEDRGSSNGSFINGKRVTTERLGDGDQIQIGTTELRFQLSDMPAAATESSFSGSGSNRFLQSLVGDSTASRFGSGIYPSGHAMLPSLVIDEEAENDLAEGSNFELLRIDNGPRPPVKRPAKPSSDPLGSTMGTIGLPPRAPVESLAEIKLRLIQRIGEKLVRIFEPKQLMDEIMSIVIEQSGADRGILCLLDDRRQPVPITSHGLAEGEQVRVSRTVLQRLLDGRSGVLIQQTGQAANIYQSLQEMRVVSTLCVPLWTGDNIIGLLSLDSTRPAKVFTPEDLDILMAVAHQAAIGIERGRLSQAFEQEREVRAYLSKYLDANIVERISQRDAEDPLAPAQRVVTVLFSDIVSFTKMSEGLEPAEVAGFISSYLTKMTDIIFAHGGTIDKYIGDAVMALFGAPMPSEDSGSAAIRAALEMRDALNEFQVPGGHGGKLRARFGINTGMVVVGNIGSSRRMEYTAIGDTVNVASRLQTFARPNEIVIDEGTYAKSAGQFLVEEIGAIDVKNRAQPIIVYKVLRAKG